MTPLALILVYIVVSTALMSVYGSCACPGHDALIVGDLVAMYGVAFCAAWVVIRLLEAAVIGRSPALRRPLLQLVLTLLVYLVTALGVGVFNYLVRGFHISSGVVVLVGTMGLGAFISIDAALGRERRTYAELRDCLAFEGKPFSITRKMVGILSVTLLFTAGVVSFIILYDVSRLSGLGNVVPIKAVVLRHVFGSTAVILGLAMRVLYSYSRNLRILFDAQLGVLRQVEAGDLETHVPVVTRDEMSVIAGHTNRMINGLREKETILQAFGKVVSPPVAQRLLSGDPDQLRTGQRHEAAILFCDIRGFTPISESATPEQIVALLNEYFTPGVEAIRQHGGIVDKFVGDAVLAVFGLDQLDGAVVHALAAARELVTIADGLRTPAGDPLRNGVGIHYGDVVAGTIGAPSRFEYTVIGDTVNVASRLEGLCRSLERRIVVSEQAYALLSDGERQGLESLGPHKVKGKSEPVAVYGI